MMNMQRSRWMMLGWLGRCQHLIYTATGYNFISRDKRGSIPFFSPDQQAKLHKAAKLIGDVLDEIKSGGHST